MRPLLVRLRGVAYLPPTVAALALAWLLIGCEKQREKGLEIQAPGVEVEINKSNDKLEIEAKKKNNNESNDF